MNIPLEDKIREPISVTVDYDKAACDVSMTVEAPSVLFGASLVSFVTFSIDLPSSFRYHVEVYLALTQALLRIIDRF
ncbi:unnamed protein product [Eruca vesicaria subsp. sativa]|uniref:Uncharacterized protein n=1 Tax=Eruca vesicaria subsp. sativa TaxID=29727 RepID=A0ABC8KTF7_ERUVS|nr:unnamed protein product [Eruca vesicaria subsp. sativa]